MKVLAINSSPRMDKGNTAFILTAFLEGMKDGAAEVDLFHTMQLNIRPCTGEFNCHFKTPGSCYQHDDMQMLYPKLREADVWVFAGPVYMCGFNGPMKNLFDRMFPLVSSSPFVVLKDGRCCNILREGKRNGKAVLVASCGFWGTVNFDLLIAQMKSLSKTMEREFAGALLRPTGPLFRKMVTMGAPVNDILQAARDAGRQLAEHGKMSTHTLSIVSREVVLLQEFVPNLNNQFKHALDALNKR